MATFGYTVIGATTAVGTSPAGTKFTAPESGTITKIWYYSFAGTATRTAVYADSAGSPAAKLAESTEVTPGNGVWAEYPLSLAITGGTVYWLMGWGCDTKYDTGDANQGGYQTGQTYPTWPDPFNETALNDAKLSIYAEYTPSGGVPVGSALL